MIVELRTVRQATRVAELTGGRPLRSDSPGPKHPEKLSRRVSLVGDFDAHRAAVESVSVLFKLFEASEDGGLVELPTGWTVTAAKFEVEWPQAPGVIHSHFGARRKAYNWALGQVKADMDTRKADLEHVSIPWNLAGLRKEWNRAKDTVAPWWAENSKEAYNSGIADLVDGLNNWKSSKNGQRKGRNVQFPKFRCRHKDHNRVRFTTGTMRLEADRRTITLPMIGPLRSKEATRRLARPLSQGRAQILNMTLSEQWGRLFVSVNYAIRTRPATPPAKPGVRAGVDLGLRTLATIADSDGNIREFGNPTPLRAALAKRRQAGRQLSRRIPGSKGHQAAKAKLAKMDRRAVHLRREAWHQLTHRLASTYGEVVIEDLDIAAMKKSMGRRVFRRSVSDTALGAFRPMLDYKSRRTGTVVTVADRWFASSQIHHGCGCRLIAPSRMAKQLVCAVAGELVDRDHNAALNLRDWPGHASPGPVGASAPVVSSSVRGGGDAGSDAGTTRCRGSDCKTSARIASADRGEARTEPVTRRERNPERGRRMRRVTKTHSSATGSRPCGPCRPGSPAREW